MVFEIQTFNLAQIKHLHTTPKQWAFLCPLLAVRTRFNVSLFYQNCCSENTSY